MAMTGVVKDELSRVTVIKPCCRKAEVSTLLRFAGGLHLAEGRVVIEAELDTGAAARRLRASITEVFGHPAEFLVLAPSGLRKGNRYLVRVDKGQAGEILARQAGLIDSHGRPVRGLPRQVVSGATCDCEAAWRGAFLAHGSLTEPGRSMALEITCPGSEAALALVGAARRLKVHAKARDVRGVDRVVIRDGEAIAAMLTRLGAHQAVLAWEERRMRREVRATANRLANFDDANLRRSARAAVAAGARVERALEILGPDAPQHLTMAGHLRMAHRQASLEELGQLADPPLTKDAIAGRIRRLLAMADRRAGEQGIPSTEACLTADMHQPGDQGRRRPAHDPGARRSPPPGPPAARSDRGRPERDRADDGQQRGQQGEPGDEHQPDRDGQRGGQPRVEAERRGGQRQQRGDEDARGERDRLTDPRHRQHDRLAGGQPGPHLLPHPEHQEQRVVGARAEHQHDQQQRGDLRDTQPVDRGLGGEPLGDQHHDQGGQHGDQRREGRPEHRHEQGDHEDDREPLDLTAGLGRGRVGVHPGRHRARGVCRQPGRQRRGPDDVAQAGHQAGLLGGGQAAGLGQRG